MHRFVFALLGMSVVLVQQAWAQQPTPVLTLSYRSQTSLMPYLNDKQLHEELKLTADQAKQLTAFRTKWYGTKPKGDRSKELEAILNLAQLQRLEQVGLRQMMKSKKGFSKLVAGAISDALKLTAEQSPQFTNQESLEKVLTPDQRKAWDALLGQPFLAQMVAELPSGFGQPGGKKGGKGVAIGTDPINLRLLQAPDVQKDLSLSAEQEKKIAEITDRFSIERAEVLTAAKFRDLTTAIDKDLYDLLTPPQEKRLKQLLIQSAIRSNPIAIFDYIPARAQLKLVPEHLEQIAAIRKDGEESLNKLFLSGQPYQKIAESIKQSKQATYEKVVGSLSPEQRETLKNLTGPPFKGMWPTNLPVLPKSAFTAVDHSDAIGRFAVLGSPILLSLPTLRKELKLPDDQVNRASLTPEQNKRAIEICLQEMDYLAGPMYLFIYKEVADPLNLNADQKVVLGPLTGKAWQDQLNRNRQNSNSAEPLRISDETRREQSEQLAKILTPEQQKRMTSLKGDPFGTIDLLARELYLILTPKAGKGGKGGKASGGPAEKD